MANRRQLEQIRQGAYKWNKWAEEHLRDDAGAKLARADLSGRDLFGAILTGADLRRACLNKASLHLVSLKSADLAGADLKKADLKEARLDYASLRDADLTGAELVDAVFQNTDLTGANFANATLDSTVFIDVDLSKVNGLESCRHCGPSVLDIHTLSKSWPLPLSFLRGCGLPETLIEYLPSLLNTPIQFYSCFISYSTKDDAFAQRLHADLQNKGVRCWFAPEDLKIGDRFRQRIDEAIRVHDKLLLILSAASVMSDWVREEVESCLERERHEKRVVLFPVRLDEAIMSAAESWAGSIKRQRHIGDFRRWKQHESYQKAFERLLHDLRAEAHGLLDDRSTLAGPASNSP